MEGDPAACISGAVCALVREPRRRGGGAWRRPLVQPARLGAFGGVQGQPQEPQELGVGFEPLTSEPQSRRQGNGVCN